MKYTEREVLQFVEENDVKFVKLMFCDVFGNLKSISVPSGELPSVFRHGYYFDASQMDGFMGVSDTDLVLRPVLDTLSLLPWRPQHGRVMRLFCAIYRSPSEKGQTVGEPFVGDGRHYLAEAVARAKKLGLEFSIGTSCEFYVFELDAKGIPTKIPHDFAGKCEVAPADRGENLRRDICMTLEKMEIYPSASRHESGPGQNEIDFNTASPLTAADNLITFKNTVKSVSDRNGLYASFMPKPLPGKSGSSLQVMISCTSNGDDVFRQNGAAPGIIGERMIGGLLDALPAMTLFLSGVTNSYVRLEGVGDMRYIAWSDRNMNTALRLTRSHDGTGTLILRTPDNTCNPYFALGLILNACMDGVERGLSAPKPVRPDSEYLLAGADTLPTTLENAVNEAAKSDFIKNNLGDELLGYVLEKKRNMCSEFNAAQDKEIYEDVKFFYTL